jgi:two-component system, cell cycle sensor histidine kinase and response regulator CckA
VAAEHILVVEDENIIAKDLQRRLTTLGYTVSAIVSSGPDALQKAADLPLDLVLMDIVLKGDMDGVETAEHLRTRFGLPVVYLTAYADAQTLQRAKRTEPLGYLLKPFIDRQLQTTIEIALYQHKMERSLKAHAEQIQETALTARKLEAIGILAGGIAHRFNNILTTIVGRLSLAKLQVRPHEPLFVHLTEAEHAVQQAVDTTRQLLTFATGGEPVKRPTALGALLQEIHNVTLNAMQAMPAGGMLQVEAVNTQIDALPHLPLPDGAYVRITIRDQGEGIPKAYHHRIFDPYFSTKEQGRGLGLATARAIIQKHKGHMSVESAPGAGTSVSIYLPAAPTTSLPDPIAPLSPSAAPRKILIMDDEEAIRILLKEMLLRLGYEAESASDGAAAIDLYRHAQEAGQPFAAVVLDLVVPCGMGGKEALTTLRAINPEVKAIVSSGYSNDPIMADFSHYGFCGVLPKPYQLSELSAVLQQVLARV